MPAAATAHATAAAASPRPSAAPRPVVVVTGASAGVGRAIAREFGRRGWRVGLVARGRDGLDAARAEIEAAGSEALVLPLDVADADAVDAAAQAVEDRFGPIDAWVNDAMATIFSPALEIAPADFRRATEVTYLGAVWGTLAALRRMQPRDRGVIVQVGSALAYRSIPLQAPYCGAKAAMRGFTDSIRCELAHAHSKVHMTMVHMPALNTPQFDWGRTTLARQPRPMGKVFQPELAARAVFHAATHRRREWWVGASTVQAILGTRIVPGWLDRYLGRVAVDGQQAPEPLPSPRPDNLYAPVPGDHGAHGRFDAEAVPRSTEFELSRHRALIWSGLALAGATVFAMSRRAAAQH